MSDILAFLCHNCYDTNCQVVTKRKKRLTLEKLDKIQENKTTSYFNIIILINGIQFIKLKSRIIYSQNTGKAFILFMSIWKTEEQLVSVV